MIETNWLVTMRVEDSLMFADTVQHNPHFQSVVPLGQCAACVCALAFCKLGYYPRIMVISVINGALLRWQDLEPTDDSVSASAGPIVANYTAHCRLTTPIMALVDIRAIKDYFDWPIIVHWALGWCRMCICLINRSYRWLQWLPLLWMSLLVCICVGAQ